MSNKEIEKLLNNFGEWCLSNDIAYDRGDNAEWYKISYQQKVKYYIRWRNADDLPYNVTKANEKLRITK